MSYSSFLLGCYLYDNFFIISVSRLCVPSHIIILLICVRRSRAWGFCSNALILFSFFLVVLTETPCTTEENYYYIIFTGLICYFLIVFFIYYYLHLMVLSYFILYFE